MADFTDAQRERFAKIVEFLQDSADNDWADGAPCQEDADTARALIDAHDSMHARLERGYAQAHTKAVSDFAASLGYDDPREVPSKAAVEAAEIAMRFAWRFAPGGDVADALDKALAGLRAGGEASDA